MKSPERVNIEKTRNDSYERVRNDSYERVRNDSYERAKYENLKAEMVNFGLITI